MDENIVAGKVMEKLIGRGCKKTGTTLLVPRKRLGLKMWAYVDYLKAKKLIDNVFMVD